MTLMADEQYFKDLIGIPSHVKGKPVLFVDVILYTDHPINQGDKFRVLFGRDAKGVFTIFGGSNEGFEAMKDIQP